MGVEGSFQLKIKTRFQTHTHTNSHTLCSRQNCCYCVEIETKTGFSPHTHSDQPQHNNRHRARTYHARIIIQLLPGEDTKSYTHYTHRKPHPQPIACVCVCQFWCVTLKIAATIDNHKSAVLISSSS